MRVLCSSVLGIESIVVFLCFLVASTNGSFESQALAVWLGVGAAAPADMVPKDIAQAFHPLAPPPTLTPPRSTAMDPPGASG